jgi:hypothetical protein
MQEDPGEFGEDFNFKRPCLKNALKRSGIE